MGLNKEGLEVPDKTPVAMPVDFKRPVPLQETVDRLINQNFALREGADFDTVEEANDFEIDDDPIDPNTPFEREFLMNKRYEQQLEEKLEKYREARRMAEKKAEHERIEKHEDKVVYVERRRRPAMEEVEEVEDRPSKPHLKSKIDDRRRKTVEADEDD